MKLTIPRESGDPLPISVEMGQQLYLVGANGTGKSALFQHLVASLQGSNIKRIAAHRQTWFESGHLTFTARSRRDFERRISNRDRRIDARWMDHSPAEKQAAAFFDLVAKDNTRYRTIGQHIDDNNPDEAISFASTSMSLFTQLNDLLGLATLTVSLSNSNDEEILAQHRNSGIGFSIAQMSDGERAAAIMAANVLTVEPGTILLIDEPERHLHRSIIEPFLSALFARREDCAFVISTHEIALPIANPIAGVLMVRSCEWEGDEARAWDVELLESGEHLPENLKRDILGSRRRILFVEGTASSLDLPLYSTLFPDLSVIPKGSCNDVIRAVNGLRSSQEHHNVEAFGLIDRDDRTEDEVSELAQSSIFALDVCSVESLYYCSDAIEAVAHRQAESLGCDPHEMISAAVQNAVSAIAYETGLPERMAARRSERRVRNQIEALAPDWQRIMEAGEHLQIPPTVESPYAGELTRFEELARAEDLDGLTSRYPLRESNILDKIAQDLQCRNRTNYESMVVTRVREDENLARELKERISPLAELLDDESNHEH